MSIGKFAVVFTAIISSLSSCQKAENKSSSSWDPAKNTIEDASGLAIYNYADFTAVMVSDPWPNATEKFQYILAKDLNRIPDSLKQYPAIQIPVQRAISTSTTHIPSFEYLNALDCLVGFPNTNYISSSAAVERVNKGQILELGPMDKMDIEKVLILKPQVVIGHGIDNDNPRFELLKKNGIPVVLNGDWNDKSPLGKAEWIKLFGALLDRQADANRIYTEIKSSYQKAIIRVKDKVKNRPTVVSGSMYENVWNMPAGQSWAAQFLDLAGGDYLWKDSEGTGSLQLHFEEVLAKAKNAEYWISSGNYVTLDEIAKDYPHYTQFNAYKTKKVYSFSTRKGPNGGILFYELATSRPDLVLQDLIKILHPELLPDYQLTFYQVLN